MVLGLAAIALLDFLLGLHVALEVPAGGPLALASRTTLMHDQLALPVAVVRIPERRFVIFIALRVEILDIPAVDVVLGAIL